jgi:protoporphyrinogen oxidase
MTAAYQLSKAGVPVTVLEASDCVGGLARTIRLWNQKVDLGPHRFFSKDVRVNSLWLEVVGSDYAMVDRLTRIFYDGKFYDYPLKGFQALLTMGPGLALQCVFSYLKAKASSAPRADTFEDWVISRFGSKLYHMFFKTYSEKLWGIPCADLDSDFAAQRIKRFSLGEAIKNTLGLGKRGHRTLVDRFAYPHGGTGTVYERMAQAVVRNGGEVRLQTPVRRVVTRGDTVGGVELQDGSFVDANHVISTMPLTVMVKSLFPEPTPELTTALASLRYRNTILVYLLVEGGGHFPDQWIYIHSEGVGFGRITNFHNWVPELHAGEKNTILALEYWCYPEDAIWKADDRDLISEATFDLAKTNLVGAAHVLEGHVVRLPRCYPVYQTGYARHLETIIRHLQPFKNLTPIGRYGAFKYNNQDHSILMGQLAAENILLCTRKHDLWAVNTDYDDYQESAMIEADGLKIISK